MSPFFEAAFAKYGWVWIGLTFGLAAKYALLLKRGIRIRPTLLLADLLLLPLVALISWEIVNRAGLSGEAAALVTALATVGADRLVKLYTERFLKAVESEVAQVSAEVMGQARQSVQVKLSAEHVTEDIETRHKKKAPPKSAG